MKWPSLFWFPRDRFVVLDFTSNNYIGLLLFTPTELMGHTRGSTNSPRGMEQIPPRNKEGVWGQSIPRKVIKMQYNNFMSF